MKRKTIDIIYKMHIGKSVVIGIKTMLKWKFKVLQH